MRSAFVVGGGIAAMLVIACSAEQASESRGVAKEALASGSARRGEMAVMRGPRVERPTACNQNLQYYGGRIISNVKVVAVNWTARVDTAAQTKLAAFYKAVTASAYFDWLGEYDTKGVNGNDGSPGTNQLLGRGSFDQTITITPTVNATASITDDDIQSELLAQIAAGKLPQPSVDADGNVNTLYMFDFPLNNAAGTQYTISKQGGASVSCVQFCAYHGTAVLNGKSIYYGVHPDMGPGSPCNTGCGGDADYLNNLTSVHSHELIEAVTDAEVGIGTAVARPLAWYAPNAGCGEIGDICNAEQEVVAGFTVQKEWSNAKGACISTVANLGVCNGVTRPCRPCTAADNGVACTGATSKCDVASGICRACGTNADCSGATPVCDATAKTCRACTVNSDCTSGVCALGAADAKKGTCVQCTASTDCTAPSVCDTKTDTCVQCTANAQCANPKPVCDPGETCRVCNDDTECSANATGAHCAKSGAQIGACVACTTNANCTDPTKPTCNTDTNTCGTTAGGGGGGGGTAQPTSTTTASCSAAPGGTTSGVAGIAGLILGLAAFARRRAR